MAPPVPTPMASLSLANGEVECVGGFRYFGSFVKAHGEMHMVEEVSE